MNKEAEIRNLLTRAVEAVIDKAHLEAALESSKKLRIKHGIDPTGEKIHIGRAVVLWKLKEFQELGHKIVLIIGDFTAQIGDPSDKLEKRPFLTKEQVRKNLRDYLPQIGKILDLQRTEVRYNSEWLSELDFRETAELAESFSVNQMLRRRAFRDRWKKDEDISLREFLYPLMQGYDSVMVKADVELGGTDQLFNLMAGRQIQERYGQNPQDIMTTKMLIGLDGRKMSTSWGNVINIADPPSEQYGKIMSMRDEVMVDYFILATDLPLEEIKEVSKTLKNGKTNPKNVKDRLAFEIVKRYHGEKSARRAQEEFNRVFSKKELPETMRELRIRNKELGIIDLLLKAGVKSKSEARRLIIQGAVSIDGTVKKDVQEVLTLESRQILKIGKRRFLKIV